LKFWLGLPRCHVSSITDEEQPLGFVRYGG
jgi:hypothetical protein